MIYNKNFISEVIIRLDFVDSINNIDTEFLSSFQSNLGSENVEKKEKVVRSVDIKLSSNNPINEIKTVGLRGEFAFNSGIENFAIENLSCTLHTKKYESFEKFYSLFQKCINALKKIRADLSFKRIGLRYINKFKFDELENISKWDDFIKNELLINTNNFLLSDVDNLTLRRIFNNFTISNGEVFANVRYGIWNPNFPGQIIDKEFILDIDCYIMNTLLSFEEIDDKFKDLNIFAYRYFELFITEKLKQKLNE